MSELSPQERLDMLYIAKIRLFASQVVLNEALTKDPNEVKVEYESPDLRH